MHLLPVALLTLAIVAPAGPSAPDPAECARENRFCAEVQRLASHPAVRRAFASIEGDAARARRELIELTQIPAPPFKEEA
ncbi:MAG: hypothetical protein KY464_13360, partial [Gemmatimonadetes bacterium]|nr:hypothetical protein [Gemmatimonadota bacterium]